MTRFERRIAIAGLIVAVAGVLVPAGVSLVQSVPAAPAAAPSPTLSLLPATGVPPRTAPLVPEQTALEWLFSSDPVGRRLDFLEQRIGLPTQTLTLGPDDLRTYDVDRCRVELRVRGGEVHAARLYLSPICTLSWRKVSPNHAELPTPNLLFFRNVFAAKEGYTVRSECLMNCGNAVDPSVELVIGGSHADGFVEAALGAVADKPANLTAHGRLADALAAKVGEDAVVSGQFCSYTLDGLAESTIADARADYIELRPQDYRRSDYLGADTACG